MWTTLHSQICNLDIVVNSLKKQTTKLTQGEINNPDKSVPLKLIAFTNKNFHKKVPGPDYITWEFYWTVKEEIMLIVHNLFQNIQEVIKANSFYENNATLISKSEMALK